MFTNFRTTAIAAVTGVALAGNAWAAGKCGEHDQIVKALSSKYKESRRVMGLVSTQSVMEMFMSPQGTWTMLVTNTQGESCIIAAGEAWQELEVKTAGLDS
jgi:hypothetical protein